MAKFTLGGREFAARRPSDLDEQLRVSAGSNAAELAGMMGNSPHMLARALRPWLQGDDVPHVNDLSVMIAEAGANDVAAQVRALYAAAEPAKAEPKGTA